MQVNHSQKLLKIFKKNSNNIKQIWIKWDIQGKKIIWSKSGKDVMWVWEVAMWNSKKGKVEKMVEL